MSLALKAHHCHDRPQSSLRVNIHIYRSPQKGHHVHNESLTYAFA